jgi:hypothetical protein
VTTGRTNSSTGKPIAQESAHVEGHMASAGAVRPCALTMRIAETTDVISSERMSDMTIVL